jgi:hypothetical protein
MNVGMLWLDSESSKDLGVRIGRAVDHYRSKYGVSPTACYVHPSMLSGDVRGLPEDVRLMTSESILRHHIWVGVEEQRQAA